MKPFTVFSFRPGTMFTKLFKQIFDIFVNTLDILKTIGAFMKVISLKVNVYYHKNNKLPIFYMRNWLVNASKSYENRNKEFYEPCPSHL